MKKKSFEMIIICIFCAALLAACGKKENDNSGISDDPKDTAAIAAEQAGKDEKPEPSMNAADEPAKEETPKGVPGLLLFRQNEYKWNESSTPAIRHRFTYLMLDGDSAGSNKALAESLEAARDEMLSNKKKAWDDDLNKLEENDMISFDESWKVYLRRADEDYLSFVTEYRSEGMYDDIAYTEYLTHSYHVDSGKELAFSDVVANEDAFFDLMTEKLYGNIDSKLQQYYSTGIGTDKETFKKDLKEYIGSGELGWTLDPFGVTCYLPAYKAAPFAESAAILFSEDSGNTIFKDEFRDSAREDYVIQIPEYVGSYIDINDSGVPSYVQASEYYDYDASSDDLILSGLSINSTGAWKNIPTTMPGGTDFYNIFLLHKDGETVLFENHDEYDQSFINTYLLARHEVGEADSIRGCLEWASQKDYDINGEGYTPVYVPTDPSKIRVLTGEGEFAGDWSPAILSVDTKGKIESISQSGDGSLIDSDF